MPMSNKEAFIRIIEIISSSDVRSEEGSVIIDLPENYNEDKKTKLMNDLLEIGYLHSEMVFESNAQVWLNKRATHWDGGICPFYNNIENLWQKCYRSDSLPHFFYVITERLSFLDNDTNNDLINLNLFFTWKSILQDLADHFANEYYVFFLINDKSGDKLEIESSLDFTQLPRDIPRSKDLEIAKELKQKLDFEDLHKVERRSVMRATLAEITKNRENSGNLLELLLKSSIGFNNKYNEIYEIYTKRFSVNKLLNELDEKSLEFTSKINEFISSSQTKALTIPGALIAVGALAKVDAPLEAFIILAGLWMMKRVNNSSNDVYREAFAALENRLNNAFKKYLKFHNELEVKQSATDIKTELSTLITKSSSRLDTLDRLANYMFYGGAAYLVIKLTNSYFYPKIIYLIKELIIKTCSH